MIPQRSSSDPRQLRAGIPKERSGRASASSSFPEFVRRFQGGSYGHGAKKIGMIAEEEDDMDPPSLTTTTHPG
jgi:hypothetical protein